MLDSDFEHLDDKNFERMATALCAEHITRALRIYGSGTDGGREATFDGKMHYSTGGPQWNGYLVVQCKQKQSRGTPKEEAAWAIGQLDEEMGKYLTAKKKRKLPDYFLFITNAHLSAQLETGGKDKFIRRLDYWKKELGLKDADVWDRDKLNNLVNITPKVAQRFGLLHSGNLIHYAAHAYLAHQEGVETTLSVFLQEELRTDQFVLAQAGHASDDRPPLARVFVDLQASSEAEPREAIYVVKHIQHVSNRPLHPTLLKEERQAFIDAMQAGDEAEDEESAEYEPLFEDEEERKFIGELHASMPEDQYGPSRHVIVGGPGQGKSTLGQSLAQRHRAALLKADTAKTLEVEITRALRVIESAAVKSGTGLPTYPRWPFRIILEDFAGALAKGEVASVLEYIASLVRKRTKRPFSASDVEALLTNMPVFVVFDGLDEVPAVSNRAEVLDAVRRFLFEARNKDADLLVIATTRPQGYQAEFYQFGFTELTLLLLTQAEALAYAKKLVEVKYATDADRQERIMERLQTAAREEAIMRLMRSPLQITIMAALVDSIGILPRERYFLFERYYEIIYQREQERGLALSRVLAEHRTTIEILHDRIGLLLQVEAESKGKTDSRISGERLRHMVQEYLVQEEHSGDELALLTASFMDVALHRLVFIVPLEDNRYGFEVRSLQEFSAARALMRGDYPVVKERLRAIVPVPYWRNTMLFAIGQAFAKQNTQHCDLVMQLCRELDDSDDTVLFCTRAGSRLALDVLEDGIVALQPRYRRLFSTAALLQLRLPHPATAERLVHLYTPREEEQYKKEVQAVMGSSKFDELPGAFVALASLANREVAWAEELLHYYWPTPFAQQRVLLELPARYKSDAWFDAVIQRVASASSLEWVIDHLRRRSQMVEWVNEASRLRFNRQQNVYLAGKETPFYFTIIWQRVSSQLLDSLPHQQLTHYDWQPFILGREFMRNPSPEALADTLEALVKSGSWLPGRLYEALPWQLEPLLTEAQSPEELLHHAQRARAGELGTAQDWQKAEARWKKHRVTLKDLTTISDSEWPYTGKIAQRGFIPVGYFGLDNTKENNSALLLLQAFSQAAATRYRSYLAIAFFFAAGHSYDTMRPFTLPLAKIEELALATHWHVQGITVLGLLEDELDWVGEIKTLDIIGNRISILGYLEDRDSPVKQKIMPEAVTQLVPLVGSKHIREGILRLLATLAVGGADVPVPDLDPNQLSAEGRVALVTLNLFGKVPRLLAASLTQQIEKLWEHAHQHTSIHEVRRVLSRVCDRRGKALSQTAMETLRNLYAGETVDTDSKLQILQCFMFQLQYRTSGFANPARKEELAMEWLFEILN